MTSGEKAKDVPTVESSVTTKKTAKVVVRTRGFVASFKGLGFPEITRKGTEMTPDEYETALKAAKRQGIRIEEVSK